MVATNHCGGVGLYPLRDRVGFGTVPDYLKTINDHITVLVQIESRPGLANVDAIAAVDWVDGVFVGPQDLAAARGTTLTISGTNLDGVTKVSFGTTDVTTFASVSDTTIAPL